METKKIKKKRKLMTIPHMKKKAQTAFNKFIRDRDAEQPCLACGKYSKNMHASHYIKKMSRSFLRYHPDNVHSCCAKCNLFESGNLIKYRMGLLKKIGVKRLGWIEDNMDAQMDWNREQLQQVINGMFEYER